MEPFSQETGLRLVLVCVYVQLACAPLSRIRARAEDKKKALCYSAANCSCGYVSNL